MNNRPLLILCLLRQLHEAHPIALRLPDLAVGCDSMGFPNLSPKDLASVLEDMAEKKFVEVSRDPLDESVKRYKRTEAARVHLAEHGHI